MKEGCGSTYNADEREKESTSCQKWGQATGKQMQLKIALHGQIGLHK